jgi:hypothetical protein
MCEETSYLLYLYIDDDDFKIGDTDATYDLIS